MINGWPQEIDFFESMIGNIGGVPVLEDIDNDNLDDMEIQVVICDTGFDEAPSYTCGWISNINVEGTTKVLINNKWEFMEEPYIKLFGYEE